MLKTMNNKTLNTYNLIFLHYEQDLLDVCGNMFPTYSLSWPPKKRLVRFMVRFSGF